MKNIFTFLFLLLYCADIHLTAQTNYYPETKTFHENGYTYQCDVDEASMVSLMFRHRKQSFFPGGEGPNRRKRTDD